jgi:phage terminase small subunit
MGNTKTKKYKPKTMKQKKWAKRYIETGNATLAAMEAYNIGTKHLKGRAIDSEKIKSVSSVIGTQNLKKLSLDEALEEVGLSDRYLAKRVKEGTLSTKIHTSHTEPDREVPDFNARHRYVETALKLKGYNNRLSGNSQDFTQNNNTIYMGMTDEQLKKVLEARLSRLPQGE